MLFQLQGQTNQRNIMIKLRERLDTLDALMAAIDGYHHLPIDVLSQFLLDHYTVDLDVLAQFADAFETSSTMQATQGSFQDQKTGTSTQSAA
jgi:hypothetical protein